MHCRACPSTTPYHPPAPLGDRQMKDIQSSRVVIVVVVVVVIERTKGKKSGIVGVVQMLLLHYKI